MEYFPSVCKVLHLIPVILEENLNLAEWIIQALLGKQKWQATGWEKMYVIHVFNR